jgi:hypothetical protein
MNLLELGTGELLELVRIHTGYRLRRDLAPERLVQILERQDLPQLHEFPETEQSRKSLQGWIMRNWQAVNSQLPCKGELRGRCYGDEKGRGGYPCTDARHLDCWLFNKHKVL